MSDSEGKIMMETGRCSHGVRTNKPCAPCACTFQAGCPKPNICREIGHREFELWKQAATPPTSNERLLHKALTELLDRYVRLVNCGDCGNWDPEKEGEVAQARAALRLAKVAPYAKSPSECDHAQARIVCPHCGIDLTGTMRHDETTGSDAEDAAKWRAFRNCARIRVIGGAGFGQDDNYRFLTLEAWTEYPGVSSDLGAIDLLEKFVAASRKTSPVEPTPQPENVAYQTWDDVLGWVSREVGWVPCEGEPEKASEPKCNGLCHGDQQMGDWLPDAGCPVHGIVATILR